VFIAVVRFFAFVLLFVAFVVLSCAFVALCWRVVAFFRAFVALLFAFGALPPRAFLRREKMTIAKAVAMPCLLHQSGLGAVGNFETVAACVAGLACFKLWRPVLLVGWLGGMAFALGRRARLRVGLFGMVSTAILVSATAPAPRRPSVSLSVAYALLMVGFVCTAAVLPAVVQPDQFMEVLLGQQCYRRIVASGCNFVIRLISRIGTLREYACVCARRNSGEH
jgi:hypothetical protein